MRLIRGDVFEVLDGLEPESFDAILCDPPYLLEFMGRAFDTQHRGEKGATEDERAVVWHRRWISLGMPLLRPGGRLVAASGSRVYHQLAMAAAMERFSVDPLFAWINGQPMAQGLAIDKAIDKAAGAEREVVGLYRQPETGNVYGGHHPEQPSGFGSSLPSGVRQPVITAPATPLAALFEGYATRLKDAVCPWLMAHKPPAGTWAQNAERHGLAGLNIEEGRVPTSSSDAEAMERVNTPGSGRFKPAPEGSPAWRGSYSQKAPFDTTQGRYPSNAALSPEAAEELGRQSGESGGASYRSVQRERNKGWGNSSPGPGVVAVDNFGDSGTASRFFHTFQYQAKAGPQERMRGCESFFWRVARDHPLGFERITLDEWAAMDHLPSCRPGASISAGMALGREEFPLAALLGHEVLPGGCSEGCRHRERYQGNIHPTLKPIALVEYLAKLVLPPDTGRPRRVLVPFAGTCSEVIGCLKAGWDEVVAIETEPVYCEIGEARIRAWGPYGEQADQAELFA